MLRLILGSGRRQLKSNITESSDLDSDVEKENPTSCMAEDGTNTVELEAWSDWIVRATHYIEEQCQRLAMDSWVIKARKSKWQLAERVLTQDSSRWSKQSLLWDPQLHFDGLQCKAHRRQSRPKLRWSGDINQFLERKGYNMIEAIGNEIVLPRNLHNEFSKDDWR